MSRDVRAEIVDYLRGQAAIHRAVGNEAWAQCLSAYADLIEQQPANEAFVARLLAEHGAST